MEIIDQEFKKSDPDFEIIDKNLQVLKFFSRFDKNTRMNLLKHSSLRKFACTEIIFNQGDYGNYMYVVLQGAVNIRKSYKTKSNQLQNTVINTLYDGETFGELALMGTTEKKEQDVKDLIKKNNKNEQECEKQKKSQKKVYIERTKRMATTQAAETTYVLAISREYFKKILLGSSQKELDDKLNFLINMPGFSVI